jgi:hypothetical protein
MEENDKKRFLSYELGILTLKAALSARDDKYPIYNKETKVFQRSKAKKVLRDHLAAVEARYSQKEVSEDEHIVFITDASSELSRKLSRYLHQGRFRIGVTQKLINVHLKYLWTAGLCPEPPHCPIDGIIRDIAGIKYNWISSDSVDEYLQAIAELKKLASAKGHSLAQWELESFRRREDAEL